MPSALVIDDDQAVRSALSDVLERAGHTVAVAPGGREGLASVVADAPDVVLLDLSMPGMDGWQVLERLRSAGPLPAVIVISAFARESDKVRALRMGADDYITKPFSNPELLARIGSVTRRSPGGDGSAALAEIVFGSLAIDRDRRAARCDGEALDLTKSEYDLLVTLAAEPNRAFTRRQLADRAFGADWFGDEHAIDMHVSRLRRKLADPAGSPRFIETVRGVGFRMASPPATPG